MKENEMKNIGEKVRYLIEESGYNLTQFADRANRCGYQLTRQTLSSIINGKNPYPTVNILNSIVQVCHRLGNDKLKTVTFDFLLNDDIKDLEAVNAQLHYELGLSEAAIQELKFESYPLVGQAKEIDYFIQYTRYHYWQQLARVRTINEIIQYKIDHRVFDTDKIKEKLMPITKDNEIYCYLYQFHRDFLNDIKKYIKNMDNMEEEIRNREFKNICDQLNEINNSFKYSIIEMTRKMIETR